MTVRIVEVIGRSIQGITRPFICRGDDGQQYFVKGNGAGRRALIAEWMAGHVGVRLGLPIPTFKQTLVPSELVELSAREDIRELGAGTGFGSQLVENADELAYLFVGQVEPDLRAKLLLYDWWICNSDRCLTEDGGNVNLLWTHHDHRLHVIDQNLAFDEGNMGGFWDEHVFRESRREWTANFREEISRSMTAVLGELSQWWRQMPEAWTEIETGLTLAGLQRLLSRFQDDPATFWRAP